MIEIVGQQEIINFLSKLVLKNTLPNSLLFTAQSGVGKFSAAMWLAAFVNCAAEAMEKPCGKCISCRKIEKKIHPDLKIVSPDVNTFNIKVDQIRELSYEAQFPPSEGRRKVFIIRDAHRMLDGAANSFLKILEEPPPYMLYILTASDPQAVIPTVLSRCCRIRFADIDRPSICRELMNNKGLDAKQADLLSRISCGSLGKASAYASGSGKLELRADIMRILLSLNTMSAASLSLEISNYCASSNLHSSLSDLYFIREIITLWLRDLMLLKGGVDINSVINIDFADRLQTLAASVSFDSLVKLASFLDDVAAQTALNVSPKLICDRLFQAVGGAVRLGSAK